MPRKKKEVAENTIGNRKIELTKEEMLERGKKVIADIQKTMEKDSKTENTIRKMSQKDDGPSTNDENKKVVSSDVQKENQSKRLVSHENEGKKKDDSVNNENMKRQRKTKTKEEINEEVIESISTKKTDETTVVESRGDKAASMKKEIEETSAIGEDKKTDKEKKTTKTRKTGDFTSGESVSFCGQSFTVLDQDEESVLLISNKLISTGIPFSMVGNNDWRKSYIKRYLQEEVLDTLNKEDLLPITIDLTADSGETDYGETQELIAIPTDNMYRKYHNIIPEYKTSVWSATQWAVKYTDSPCFVSIRGRNKMLYSEKAENNIGVVMICKLTYSHPSRSGILPQGTGIVLLRKCSLISKSYVPPQWTMPRPYKLDSVQRR